MDRTFRRIRTFDEVFFFCIFIIKIPEILLYSFAVSFCFFGKGSNFKKTNTLLVPSPEILPVVTKQAVTKKKLDGRKQTSRR